MAVTAAEVLYASDSDQREGRSRGAGREQDPSEERRTHVHLPPVDDAVDAGRGQRIPHIDQGHDQREQRVFGRRERASQNEIGDREAGTGPRVDRGASNRRRAPEPAHARVPGPARCVSIAV